MSKKSLLASLFLAGLTAFPGCNPKAEKSDTKSESKAEVQHVSKNEKTPEEQIKEFNKAVKEIPAFRDELPYAMILSDDKGGHVQMLYPAKRNGIVVESKEQYEKRVKWLNEKYPVDIPKADVSLRGCKWENYTTPPQMPFVSIFDKPEYIQHHLGWMKKFWEKQGLPSGEKYSPQNDPVALWWVEQDLPRQLAAEHKAKSKIKVPPKNLER